MNIRDEIKNLAGEAIKWRRDIHKHPELGFEENRTSDLVARVLTEKGIEVHRGLAKTGVVGTLNCGEGGKTIALRADMDALPLEESNTFDYRSINPNKMHACGHDGHTAMLLGAAACLAESRAFNGTVHFIFQPAEEGLGGADVMIKEGLFDQFPAEAVYGMHNWPGLPVGEFAICAGPMMASFDSFDIMVKGAGGHGAMPHLAVDPVVIASQLVGALQSIVSRNVRPIDPAVISVTHIRAGEPSYNVIPDQVLLQGGVRAMDNKTRKLIEERIHSVTKELCLSHGATSEINYNPVYPVLMNEDQAVRHVTKVAQSIVGEKNVRTGIPAVMGSEDFAFMLEKKPGAYIFIGNGEGEGGCPVHNPSYDFNDEIIGQGIEYWCRVAESHLR